MSIKSILIT